MSRPVADGARPTLLLFGGQGQVGWELARSLAPLGRVVALDRAAVDLTDLAAVRAAIATHRPRVVVNAAAYTAVDRAESERALAERINAEAPAAMAAAAAALGALLVHYSTDYVFDGRARAPYREDAPTAPQGAYGATKLAGDEAVLAGAADAWIFRVSWVYAARGRNFLRTIQRLAAERDELRIVDDQVGCPTWAREIAEATALAVGRWLSDRAAGYEPPARGVYHLASPDHTSWHGFASAIVDALPAGAPRPAVRPITTAEYPTPAARPAWSVLDPTKFREAFGLALSPWREQLARCLDPLT